MSGWKAIAIMLLLVIGFNLLLYGYMRRRIDAAKREKGLNDER
jgi:hypothetical protein